MFFRAPTRWPDCTGQFRQNIKSENQQTFSEAEAERASVGNKKSARNERPLASIDRQCACGRVRWTKGNEYYLFFSYRSDQEQLVKLAARRSQLCFAFICFSYLRARSCGFMRRQS